MQQARMITESSDSKSDQVQTMLDFVQPLEVAFSRTCYRLLQQSAIHTSLIAHLWVTKAKARTCMAARTSQPSTGQAGCGCSLSHCISETMGFGILLCERSALVCKLLQKRRHGLPTSAKAPAAQASASMQGTLDDQVLPGQTDWLTVQVPCVRND
jgi:hypothetical protein